MRTMCSRIAAAAGTVGAAGGLVLGVWAAPALAAPGVHPTIAAPKSPVGQCPYPAGDYPVFLPDSEDPAVYYECDQNGVPVRDECSPGLHFNPDINTCDIPPDRHAYPTEHGTPSNGTS